VVHMAAEERCSLTGLMVDDATRHSLEGILGTGYEGSGDEDTGWLAMG
jgi:hypothetical protein